LAGKKGDWKQPKEQLYIAFSAFSVSGIPIILSGIQDITIDVTCAGSAARPFLTRSHVLYGFCIHHANKIIISYYCFLSLFYFITGLLCQIML
jgi:hypothetical protein